LSSRTPFDLIIAGDPIYVTPLLSESGGHRFQRIPPTERKGRIQTSTVTVAVFEIVDEKQYVLKDSDIQTFVTRDSGPGGQHRNKTESCIVMRHIPTGIEAKASAKCQHQNRRTARAMLEARVTQHYNNAKYAALEQDRQSKVGSGMRGDKIRTYREKDDVVIDHRTNRKTRLSVVLKGDLSGIYQ
jgi:peptide chain release factor 1